MFPQHVSRLAREDEKVMGDFNRKVEETTSRVGKTVGETTERVEKEATEFIKYLNDEVVPAVRQRSTKALRVAAQKLHDLANYMDKHSAARK
jgi:hypothetical protein